jgi:hypothetical protein
MGMTSSPVCLSTQGVCSRLKRDLLTKLDGPFRVHCQGSQYFLMYTLFKLGILGKIYSSTSHGTYHGFFI